MATERRPEEDDNPVFLDDRSLAPSDIFPVMHQQNKLHLEYNFKTSINGSLKYVSLPIRPNTGTEANVSTFITMCSIAKTEISTAFNSLDVKYSGFINAISERKIKVDVSTYRVDIDGYSKQLTIPLLVDTLATHVTYASSCGMLYKKYLSNVDIYRTTNVDTLSVNVKLLLNDRLAYLMVMLKMLNYLKYKTDFIMARLTLVLDDFKVYMHENKISDEINRSLLTPDMPFLRSHGMFAGVDNNVLEIIFMRIQEILYYTKAIFEWGFLVYTNLHDRIELVYTVDKLIFNACVYCLHDVSGIEKDPTTNLAACMTDIGNFTGAYCTSFNLAFGTVYTREQFFKPFYVALFAFTASFCIDNIRYIVPSCECDTLEQLIYLCDLKNFVNVEKYRVPLQLISWYRELIHVLYKNGIYEKLAVFYTLLDINIVDRALYNTINPKDIPSIEKFGIESNLYISLHTRYVLYYIDSLYATYKRFVDLIYIYLKKEESVFSTYYEKLNAIMILDRLKIYEFDRLCIYLIANTADRINQFIILFNKLYSNYVTLADYANLINVKLLASGVLENSSLFDKMNVFWTKTAFPSLCSIVEMLPCVPKNIFSIQIDQSSIQRSVPYAFLLDKNSSSIQHLKNKDLSLILKYGGYINFAIGFTALLGKNRELVMSEYIFNGKITQKKIWNKIDYKRGDINASLLYLLSGPEPILHSIEDININGYVPFQQLLFSRLDTTIINLGFVLECDTELPYYIYQNVLAGSLIFNNCVSILLQGFVHGVLTPGFAINNHHAFSMKYSLITQMDLSPLTWAIKKANSIRSIFSMKMSSIYAFDAGFDKIIVDGSLKKSIPFTFYGAYDIYNKDTLNTTIPIKIEGGMGNAVESFRVLCARMSDRLSLMNTDTDSINFNGDGVFKDKLPSMIFSLNASCKFLFSCISIFKVYLMNLAYKQDFNVNSEIVYWNMLSHFVRVVVGIKAVGLVLKSIMNSMSVKNDYYYNNLCSIFHSYEHTYYNIIHCFRECGTYICSKAKIKDNILQGELYDIADILYMLHGLDVHDESFNKTISTNFYYVFMLSTIKFFSGLLCIVWQESSKVSLYLSSLTVAQRRALSVVGADKVVTITKELDNATLSIQEFINKFNFLLNIDTATVSLENATDLFKFLWADIGLKNTMHIKNFADIETSEIMSYFNTIVSKMSGACERIDDAVKLCINGITESYILSGETSEHKLLSMITRINTVYDKGFCMKNNCFAFVGVLKGFDSLLKLGKTSKFDEDALKGLLISFSILELNQNASDSVKDVVTSPLFSEMKFNVIGGPIANAPVDIMAEMLVLENTIKQCLRDATIIYKQGVTIHPMVIGNNINDPILFRCICIGSFMMASTALFFGVTEKKQFIQVKNLWSMQSSKSKSYVYSLYGGLNTEYVKKTHMDIAKNICVSLEIAPVLDGSESSGPHKYIFDVFISYMSEMRKAIIKFISDMIGAKDTMTTLLCILCKTYAKQIIEKSSIIESNMHVKLDFDFDGSSVFDSLFAFEHPFTRGLTYVIITNAFFVYFLKTEGQFKNILASQSYVDPLVWNDLYVNNYMKKYGATIVNTGLNFTVFESYRDDSI